MLRKANKPVSFILSTGRTGTQFFSNYLSRTCEGLLCLHEPFPSRRFKWYSNFYLNGKLSKEFIAKQYLAKRKNILHNDTIDHYVESSNFLFGCVQPINEAIEELRIIHIVRHPITYTVSHLNKGFWSGIKGFTARNIPGWLEFIDKEIKSSGDPIKILLARWVYVNNVISSYQNTNAYFTLRFEDVFAKDAVNPVNLLNQTREFLGCGDLGQNEQEEWLKVRPNKSRKDLSKKWPVQKEHLDFIIKKGEDLLRKFNYTIDDQFINNDHEEVA
jgi:hypothetical protein